MHLRQPQQVEGKDSVKRFMEVISGIMRGCVGRDPNTTSLTGKPDNSKGIVYRVYRILRLNI